jgi:malto-oligosyltrehalose trehalohydrolase
MDPLFGPRLQAQGTRFRLYAPSLEAAQLVLDGRQPIDMQRGDTGFWTVFAQGVGDGARYRFRVNGRDVPDVASRRQQTDSAGWSLVRAPLPPPPEAAPRPFHEAVICEVHVGTVSPEGTFAGLMHRLEHFRDAGYTAIELMPVNSFPGTRNWGYDGTLLFAPAPAYGTPADLRALVDRAHALGLCMLLDVVYNHFGDIDNFLPHYAPEFFADGVETPWGAAINFDDAQVRRFYVENALMWLTEYGFDGLRFDAVHEIRTASRQTFLDELAEACRAARPEARLLLENRDNIASLLARDDNDLPRLFTAQWNDDLHHALHYLVTGEAHYGYGPGGADAWADLEKALRDGFAHDGEAGPHSDGRTGGEPASQLPPDAFVGFVQNHDQIGNRADARRLADRISARKLDFLHFLVMLSPNLPMFFMGEEAHLRSAFPYFFDLDDADAAPRRDGRYEQMESAFDETVEPGQLPDPNDPATMAMARLAWDDYADPQRQAALDRFRELASLRRRLVWPLLATRCLQAQSFRQGPAMVITWSFKAGWLTLVLNASDQMHSIDCRLAGDAVSTGTFEIEGERLGLDGWSALAWMVPR